MIQINIAQAKAQLSDLVLRVERGEEVVICKHNKPIARLVPVTPSAKRRTLGRKLLGDLRLPTEAFEPLTESEIEEWERPVEI